MHQLGVTHSQVFGTPVAEYLPPRLIRGRVALVRRLPLPNWEQLEGPGSTMPPPTWRPTDER
jgi:hypothetical protein